MDDLTKAALLLLDRLEAEEAKLLSWGLVDGAFTRDELLEQAASAISDLEFGAQISAAALVARLEEMVLLWELPGLDERGYRTRSAEAVRLAARLKQLFKPSQWEVGPDLVADFRYHISPRRFPMRVVSLEDLLGRLESVVILSADQQAVARSALSGGEKEFMLSKFQYEACESVLQGLKRGGLGGTLVSAGTGSGKTIAFLLPAILELAKAGRRTQAAAVLAVYPRNELLKDQLRAALSFLSSSGDSMREARGKPISIGAYFGAVPRNAEDAQHGHYRKWRPASTVRGEPALECPFLECPRCGSRMAWPLSDLRAGTERLECVSRHCARSVGPDEIRLTRDSLRRDPPDILFTSTEMLNRSLPDKAVGPLFGVGVAESPSIVVLDEVHSYEGVHGAQVALLLRRWRHLSGARPHYIALSATIMDGARFMHELTGVFEVNIRVVEPDPGQMTGEGAEYTLALRGDSSNKTSLLSTTIQTAMLFSRILDPARAPVQQRVSEGVFGTRTFLFTDNLDATNRLFDNLNDAEGWWGGGRPNRNPDGSLANLRGDQHPESQRRWQGGQGWQICQSIGHSLQNGSRTPRTVGRTSSQDQGVDPDASMVVATSSLEVGFDDPEVGAVIQHKAPTAAAAYLQRKGRAGRTQVMRPWTIVVLSDFGRDRLLYERYEDLFEPRLTAKHLPIRNPYVLRIQATFALMDWLRTRLPAAQGGQIRYALSAPVNQSDLTAQILLVLSQLITDSSVRSDFRTFLRLSLEVEDDHTLDSILWGAPRSLLLEVVPTLIRRLETGWDSEYFRPHEPLPEFLPKALFEDLNLPELELVVPEVDQPERMSLRQGLAEFAPGRVSRRFATWRATAAHWMPPSSPDAASLKLEDVFEGGSYTPIGEFAGASGEVVAVLRPTRLVLQNVPRDVAPSSNAFLLWQSNFSQTAEGRSLSIPSPVAHRLGTTNATVFCHSNGDSVEVCRFAPEVQISRLWKGGTRLEQQVAMNLGDSPAALGFLLDVDAIQFSFELPRALHERTRSNPTLVRTLRAERFRETVLSDEFLKTFGNRFSLGWLVEAALASVARWAVRKGEGVREVIDTGDALASDALVEALRTVFGLSELDEERAGKDDDGASGTEEPSSLNTKKLQELKELLERPGVGDRIRAAANHLAEDIDESWNDWLSVRTAETLAAGVLQACERLAPDSAGDSLLTDVVWADRDDRQLFSVWVTETTPGGAGAIERLSRLIQEEDQTFYALVEASFEPNDRESAIDSFEQVLARVAPNNPLYDADAALAVEGVRSAEGVAAKQAAMRGLGETLRRSGLVLHPAVVTAINLRLLKPGSSHTSDALQHRLATRWNQVEESVGFSLPPRVLAEIESHSEEHDQELAGIFGLGGLISSEERFRHLAPLLWPHRSTLRAEALNAYNPYRDAGYRDRLLAKTLFEGTVTVVDLLSETWWTQVSEALVRDGTADISSPSGDPARLRSAILRLHETAIDTGMVQVHPRVRGHSRDGNSDVVRLELPEMFA